MSHPQPPNRVKLVIGLFMKNKGLFPTVSAELTECFGPVDLISRWYPFDFTTYYEPEMGAPLFRRILAFKALIEQKQLAEIKVTTNSLEQRHSEDDKRKINIDPGYMAHERFVLATIHSVKGLEWHTVFIIWTLEGKFPSSYAFNSEEEMEEERRLMYVAATRARESLFITYPINVYDRVTGEILSKPSRFLKEIPPELFEGWTLGEGVAE